MPSVTMRPVTSALRPTGGTYAWSRLRAQFAERIRVEGMLPCWRCGRDITTADAWDLGHPVARALGDDDAEVWPEHRHGIPGICEGNRSAGARLGNQLRLTRTAGTTDLAPSRDW